MHGIGACVSLPPYNIIAMTFVSMRARTQKNAPEPSTRTAHVHMHTTPFLPLHNISAMTFSSMRAALVPWQAQLVQSN